MSPNEKLIKLMEGKQEVLDNCGIKRPRYFTKKDRMVIMKWSAERAELVWGEIYEEVTNYFDESLLFEFNVLSCPFCKAYTCRECPYGDNHGMCVTHKFDNDYSVLMDKIENDVFYPGLWLKPLVEKIQGM